MQCSRCGIEGVIMTRDLKFKGDNSPTEETQAFFVMHIHCRNPACSEFQKEIGVAEAEIMN